MESPSPIRVRSPEEDATQIAWWAALLALSVMGVCLLNGLGAIGLVGPDEPRYAYIARAMVQSGDWVTPRLYGHPWFEKPVLYYWAAAAAFREFGFTDFAARLPSALAALGATLAIAWAALRGFGLTAAWLTALILPSTIALIGFARAATPDMLFSALLAGAAVAAAEMLAKPRAGPLARTAFGIFLGAATLAKGPAAVILAGGAALLWAIGSRQWRGALRLANPVSIGAFCMVAVPWYALCAIRNPEFLRIFFLEQNFERYLTPIFHHPQPVWFFAVIIVIAMLPWTALLVPLAIDAVSGRAGLRDSPAWFFGCWALFPLLFFSLSQSKLPGYILPSVPPLGLLLAVCLARRVDSRPRTSRWWVALVGATFPVLAIVAGLWLHRLPPGSGLTAPEASTGLLLAAITGGAACALLAILGSGRAGIAAAATLMVGVVLAINTTVLPRLDPYLSARAAFRAMPLAVRQAPELAVFRMDRDWRYGLDYYLDRELPEWVPGYPRPAWLWTSAAGAAALRQREVPYTTVVRMNSKAWLVRLNGRTTAANGLRAADAAERN